MLCKTLADNETFSLFRRKSWVPIKRERRTTLEPAPQARERCALRV
jgi:hypothetical protein